MSDDGLFRKIEYLANTLERMRLDEYLDFVSNRRRMALTAFLGGVMRGVGFMFGFSIIGAVVVTILRSVVLDNIPGIGSFLAEVVNERESRTR